MDATPEERCSDLVSLVLTLAALSLGLAMIVFGWHKAHAAVSLHDSPAVHEHSDQGNSTPGTALDNAHDHPR